MPVPTLQPQNTQVVTQNEESEPIWTHFWAGLEPCRSDEVRARARFVVISSDWSDPRRSRCVSCVLLRYLPSAVASGDVTSISRELARLGQNLAFLASSRIRRTISTGGNGPGSVLLRHVLRDCINTAGRGVGIARKRPRGQKRPLLPLRSSRPLNPARRSASKAKAWLAGVKSQLAHALEHHI